MWAKIGAGKVAHDEVEGSNVANKSANVAAANPDVVPVLFVDDGLEDIEEEDVTFPAIVEDDEVLVSNKELIELFGMDELELIVVACAYIFPPPPPKVPPLEIPLEIETLPILLLLLLLEPLEMVVAVVGSKTWEVVNET